MAVVTPARAQSNLRQQMRAHLDASEFAALDELYENVADAPVELWRSYPELLMYFDWLSPYSNQDGDIWETSLAKLEEWRAERPQSSAAVMGMAKLYERWAWNARGRGYANTVSEENWELFKARLDEALALLMALEPNERDELYRDYLHATILFPSSTSFAEAMAICERINERNPNFSPAYTLPLHYLLPRWFGSDEALLEYVENVMAKLDGEKSDLLYARLMNRIATKEREGFAARFNPDTARMYQGLMEVISKIGSRSHPEHYASLANSMALCGDLERARQAMLNAGPTASFRAWGFCDDYLEALANCGADRPLTEAWQLEMAGDLAAAEDGYRGLVSDGVDNRWLRGFYLRHQRPEFFECELDRLDLQAPVSSTMGAYDLVDLSVIYSAFGDYERAEEVSRILEDKGRFAYYAWLARYQRALAEDDPVAAGEAREALCAMKISRPSHAAAQAFLCDPAAAVPEIKWLRFADFAATTLIALRLYELNRDQEADALLQAAIPAARGNYERDRMGALLLR